MLKNDLRLSVPDGFAITTAAFADYLRFNGIAAKVAALGLDRDITEDDLLEIRQAILGGEMSPGLHDEIDKALIKLRKKCSGNCRLAVRSSAVEEDGEYSFAGQYETILNVAVEGAAVKEAYQQVLASLYTVKSAAYHRQAGLDIRNGRMAVGCLCMVNAQTSGVLYSTNPGGEKNTLLVSATWGLGKSLVEGQTDADYYLIRKGLQPEISERRTGTKTSMVVNEDKGGTQTINTPPDLSGRSSLTDAQALELAGRGLADRGPFQVPSGHRMGDGQ